MNEDIDDGWLTDECRYSHLPIHSEDRLTAPAIRDANGDLQQATWTEALERVVEELSKDGLTSGILASTKLSVEDGHMLLRLGRSVLETPHVVHEFAHEELKTEESLTGRVNGCDQADVIICLGCDPSQTHPDFELRIKKGLRNKAKLVTLVSEPSMVGFADVQAVGNPSELWSKLTKALEQDVEEAEVTMRLPKPRPWEAGGETSEDWQDLLETVRNAQRVLVVLEGDLEAKKLTKVIKDVQKLGWSEAPHGVIHLRNGVNSVGLDAVGLTES